MLYILVFTRVFLSFDCCMRFDVVLALYQRCSFRQIGAMRRPIDRGTSRRLAPRFFVYILV